MTHEQLVTTKMLENFPYFISRANKLWRLENLYYIVTKDGKKDLFKLNRAQKHFLENYILRPDPYYRHIILKSRQLGFTTLINLFILDEIIFNQNKEGLVIAHTQKDATEIFNRKVKYAIRNLYRDIQDILEMDQSRSNRVQFVFPDESVSAFSVSNSGRSGTFNFLHISEFAKLCKAYPEKAREVILGTLPALSFDSFAFIESTAEGMCYSSDTEVFTENGFKLFKDLNSEDKIASMDENKKIYFTPRWKKQIWDYNGNLVQFKNQKVDLLVTPNHKMYVRRKNTYSLIEAKNLAKSKTDFNFYKTFEWVGKHQEYFTLPEYTHKQGNGFTTKPECKIPNNIFLEYLGYFLSDGSVGKNTSNIKQVKFPEPMIKISKRLAEVIGASVSLSGDNIAICSAQLTRYLEKYTKPKNIPDWVLNLPKEQLSIFFEAFYLGDGDQTRRKQSNNRDFGRIFTGLDKPLTDKMYEVCLKLGYSVNEYKNNKRKDSVVAFSDKKEGYYKTYKHEIKNVPYKGIVYCVTLEKDHVLFVRRNGKSLWSGNSGDFYEMFDKSWKRKHLITPQVSKIEFYPHFYSWTWDDAEMSKIESPIPIENMEECEINWGEYQKDNGLSDIEITYYYYRFQQLGKDIDRLHQEYPTNHMEAFIGSGSNYYNLQKIYDFDSRADDNYTRYDYINGEFVENDKGDLYVYKKPEEGRRYVIGGDVAEGLQDGDYSTACVLGHDKEIKALYRGHIEPDDYSKMIQALGRWYNIALVAVEFNKDGNWVNTDMRNMGYPNLYVRTVIDDITKNETKMYGWVTNKKNRDFALGESKKHFNSTDMVNCKPLLDELKTFIRNKRGRPEAANGKHDDVVMSWIIGLAILQGKQDIKEEKKTLSWHDLVFPKRLT